MYRPPGYNKTKFISDLTNILNDVCDVPTCLIGDFNEDLPDIAQPNKIFTTLTKAGFIQHVKGPTIDTGTLLDHFYTLNIWNIKTEVSDCYYSDHDTGFHVLIFSESVYIRLQQSFCCVAPLWLSKFNSL